ncbi:MAG: Gfo/Idh/MocA family oxidoreductase [Alphaproteobacteria bacterium]|jgi:predicted dehydrogenase|nr:Gfo/Idh/MocA family oxidoreductase [Alphaproteobacteria bacterium]MDP6567053.1 Gfo/Idh/MocA family oxidoreductase [Alphaproteobacteria bacterium]MDP6812473.1 Gfo/Idh/MocA family oxidoreductase [Alphaproteobacteria bacterium]
MADPLRIAVIGAGYFARFQHQGWQRLDGAELVGIADRAPGKAVEAAADYGIPAFEEAGKMLDAVAPDLVDIATPPASHLELVAEAAGRGLPAICQKPLAPTHAEAVAVVEAAEAAGSLLVVHENFRFQPWYREIRRLLDDGRLGQLHGIAFRLRPGDGQGPAAYLDRQPYFQAMPRFLVHETAIHFIDTFRYLMGEVGAVTARLRRLNPAIAGEDAGHILFEFQSGAAGLFDGNRLNDHVSDNTRRTMGEMWLEGARGVLRLDGGGRLWWKPHGEAEAAHAYDWSDGGFAGDCVHALQAHVLAHLRHGAPLENTGRDYLRNLEIEEAVYRSAAEGRSVTV